MLSSSTLQWGGRFSQPPDPILLAFGSSLNDDLVLAPFDVTCSHAHVDALFGGGVIEEPCAHALHQALDIVASEISDGGFGSYAQSSGAEDIHGAIDARVRELSPNGVGDWLHAGRSRNDQVAATLALFARDRALIGSHRCIAIAKSFLAHASRELAAETLLAGMTHWQPAQPISLAFWLLAAAEPFVRGARRFTSAHADALASSPLGSAALAGTTLPLDRVAAATRLGFSQPSRNAMDAIGTRDALLDVAFAYTRAVVDASRIAGEFIVWATPAFGYLRLGDASCTGSSLMPQKRNPDPFELVRGAAAEVQALANGALSSLVGLPLSYHRDLQQTKRMGMVAIERGGAILEAFGQALGDVIFDGEAMERGANRGYTVATDVADALITNGISARRAHELVGRTVQRAEREGRELGTRDLQTLACDADIKVLDAPLDARASIAAKATIGSTAPWAVRASLEAMQAEVLILESAQ